MFLKGGTLLLAGSSLLPVEGLLAADHGNRADTGGEFDLRQPVRLVGTSTCDWQWNPRDSGSDWGYELRKKQRGEPSGIIGDVDPSISHLLTSIRMPFWLV